MFMRSDECALEFPLVAAGDVVAIGHGFNFFMVERRMVYSGKIPEYETDMVKAGGVEHNGVCSFHVLGGDYAVKQQVNAAVFPLDAETHASGSLSL